MKKMTLLVAASLLLWACQNSNSGNAASTSTTTPATTAAATANNTASNSAPATVVPASRKVAEKSVSGKLIEAMDMDYPRAFVTVQVGTEKISANFSEEDPNAYKVADVKKMLKKQVVMLYKAQISATITEILANGKSIYPESVNEILPEYKKITGILNATKESGDLPSLMSVKATDGNIYEFEHFVTGLEIAQNGKTVDVYFAEVPNNELISVEVIK
jgi:hypothetical protein